MTETPTSKNNNNKQKKKQFAKLPKQNHHNSYKTHTHTSQIHTQGKTINCKLTKLNKTYSYKFKQQKMTFSTDDHLTSSRTH